MIYDEYLKHIFSNLIKNIVEHENSDTPYKIEITRLDGLVRFELLRPNSISINPKGGLNICKEIAEHFDGSFNILEKDTKMAFQLILRTEPKIKHEKYN